MALRTSSNRLRKHYHGNDDIQPVASEEKRNGRRSSTKENRRIVHIVFAVVFVMFGCHWILDIFTNANKINNETRSIPSSPLVITTKEDTSLKESSPLKYADWNWFEGNINEYYNELEAEIKKRNPNDINSVAVHRWMGEKRSTFEHYHLIHGFLSSREIPKSVRVLDAGCGLGAGLMWFERKEPTWNLWGHTISQGQLDFIGDKLPSHKFKVNLKSYDELDAQYDAIYTIEALIHSPNMAKTIRGWADHLSPGGYIIIIDDFLSPSQVKTRNSDEEIMLFEKSWLANSLVTTLELGDMGRSFGLQVIQDRDLGTEFRINQLNYRNQMPEISVDKAKNHQGWLGSKFRQRLMVSGKITYRMIILQKSGGNKNTSSRESNECSTVPSKKNHDKAVNFNPIPSQLMSGIGHKGGKQIKCLSGWYCCGQGIERFEDLEKHRTDKTAYLKLEKGLFGNYMDIFAARLNEFYAGLPAATKGKFLDIGATGSVASGMKQVTSKFSHFAGPLDYWLLDSDPSAKNIENAIFCDVAQCASAETCGFDVTFSHTVLEHSSRPWEAFDTIARITKKGGLTLHLVPFSYQYHATPDDNYRFSHKALTSLLEDRGFEVLDVGYDICSKPENMMTRRDEHYDIIWLTFVVGRKL